MFLKYCLSGKISKNLATLGVRVLHVLTSCGGVQTHKKQNQEMNLVLNLDCPIPVWPDLGKISPKWLNLKSLWQFIDALFNVR